jgi:hypothetical protein
MLNGVKNINPEILHSEEKIFKFSEKVSKFFPSYVEKNPVFRK